MKRTTKAMISASLAAAALVAYQSEGIQAATETYTVQLGDTLSQLAAQFNTTVEQLAADNDIKDVNLIITGQDLTIEVPEIEPAIEASVVPDAIEPDEPAVETDTEVVADEAEPVTDTAEYTVKQGDTLSEIAEDHDVTVDDLKTWNQIADDLIYVDQVLKVLPTIADAVNAVDDAEAALAEQEAVAAAEPAVTDGEHYTVQSGDSLSAISERLHVAIDELRRANDLVGDFIFSGQVLDLKSDEPAAEATDEEQTVADVVADTEQAAQAAAEQEAAQKAAEEAAKKQAEAAAQQAAEEAAQKQAEEAARQAAAQKAAEEAEEAARKEREVAQAQARAEAAKREQQQAQLEQTAVKKQAAPKQTPSQASGVLAIAEQYIGSPYVWGGTTPGGFDCSGFTQYVFAQAGRQLPRTSRAQATVGAHIPVSEAQPGDLLFWGDTPYHVAIYAGNGQYIHAPNPAETVHYEKLTQYWYPSFAIRM